MKKIVENERLIYKCCKLYYEEEMTQQKISEKLGISRVSVGRMLRTGKELGIVKIQIVSPDQLGYNRLAQELETLYGLKEVVVVENDPLAVHYEDQNAMSLAVIHLLESYLHDNDVVGVSMGRTLHNVCMGKRESTESINCTFVPAIGGLQNRHSQNMHLLANRLAADFAHLFGAQHTEFFAPAIFSSKIAMEMFRGEAPMREINEYYDKMKTIIMGVGIPRRFTSTIVKVGYMKAEELDNMIERGAIGDLLLQFIDRNGRTEPFEEFNSRVAGVRLEQIQRIENRLCIAGGKAKAEAIYGAICGQYVNMLVIDHDCAELLVKMKKGKDDT